MQFSVAAWPNTSWASSSTCGVFTKQTQTHSQTSFWATLFVWNSVANLCIIWLWFISVENWKWGERHFLNHTLGPSALPGWPCNITHCTAHGSKYSREWVKGELYNTVSTKPSVSIMHLCEIWEPITGLHHINRYQSWNASQEMENRPVNLESLKCLTP